MINVYAWPPVGVQGRSWTLQQPVEALRSALSSKAQMQASQRARRKVALDVSALAQGQIGAGYMEMLGELLQGGIHAVRLKSWSTNWRTETGGRNWVYPSVTGTAITDSATGMGAVRVTGLPPRFPLIKPGERFRIDGSGNGVMRAVNNAVADASGVAVIRVTGAPTGSGTLVLDDVESWAFRPDSIPVGTQMPGADWSYSWTFTQVFSDEVDGFTEIDPWT